MWTDHGSHHVYGYREDNGGASLCSNDVESLKVAELHGGGRLGDGLSCLLQCTGSIQLSICCNNLCNQPRHCGDTTSHLEQY